MSKLVYIDGVITSALERNIAELDCAGFFGSAEEVEQIRCSPTNVAWARVRRAWKALDLIEEQHEMQPELF